MQFLKHLANRSLKVRKKFLQITETLSKTFFCQILQRKYMVKFTTGTELRPKYGKIAKKNSENHIKLVKNIKNHPEIHVISHFISAHPVKIGQ